MMNWLERRRIKKLVKMTDRAIESLCYDLMTSPKQDRPIIMQWLDDMRDLRQSLVDSRWRNAR